MKLPSAIRFCAAACSFFCIPVAFAQSAPTAQPGASAASSTPSTALSPEEKKKLAALDAALKNGVLTKEEYDAKKNALYSSAHAQEVNATKLDAITKAYQSGVLTREEYERKKKELTGAATPGDNPAGGDRESNYYWTDQNGVLRSPNTGAGWKPPSSSGEAPTSAAGAATNGWTTQNDPRGFSVDTPAGWNVAADAGTGRITVRGQQGEQAVIWPMFIEQQQLDARGAGALVQQLARKVDSQMPWGAAEPSQNVVRVIARGGQRSGAAMMTWASGPNGTAVYLYCVEAPTELYHSSTDTFVGILKSFHVVQDPALKNAGAQANSAGSAPLSFVRWTDPHEGAFSMSVPQGWQVIGGAYRLSATDIRNGVTMVSPDGQTRVAVGDSNLGVFTQPTQMLALGGLREGGYQTLGDGTKLEIRRYLSGQQFAREYVEGFARRQCGDLRIDSNNARQDLASSFGQSARNEGMGNGQITAGDVAFACNLNGNAVRGYCAVATILPFPGRAPLWYVYRIYGYLAPAPRQQDAEKVVAQAMQSWQLNPEWQARESATANAAVQQDNMRSQQIQSRARQAIAEDQRQTSEIITKGYEQRQKVYDEISRKRENAILGRVDVVDPETGTRYKVDNYSDYHWMNNERYIAGTNTANSPGPGWRELVTLP